MSKMGAFQIVVFSVLPISLGMDRSVENVDMLFILHPAMDASPVVCRAIWDSSFLPSDNPYRI